MSSTVRYGLFNGLLAICWGMFMYVSGLNRTVIGQTVNYIGIIFPLVFMYLAINEYRHKEGHGYITFGRAFREAFKVGIIGGVIGMIYMFIYINVIDTDYINYLLQQQEIKFAESGMEQAQIDQMMVRTASMMTPLWFTIWGIVAMLFMSAVFSMIMAGVLKKPNPEELS